jgi:predicted GNAT family acetyltransferase
VENETDLTFVNDERHARYTVMRGNRPVAFSEYELEPGRIVFTHTVVRPDYEGQGIGSRLAKFVVEDAQARGLRITPVCPFVRAYLRRHSEYESIVDYPVSSR